MKAIEHLKTITRHKIKVMQGCFRVGLYKQGLLHDLSKYMPTEFWVGARYYQGDRSPNNAEREDKGYSEAWIHHKGRNKHHYEYWTDYTGECGYIGPVKMPIRYVIEMFEDRVAASKIYRGDAYTDRDPLAYYNRGHAKQLMHPKTAAQLEYLLRMLADKGEEYTNAYIRKHILHNDRECVILDLLCRK
ncbi:MAG: DUF5662 family protein [Lachnospiraceae bacterium]